MELVQCSRCGVKYGVDPRDKSARLCPGCYRNKSNKRILIKLGIIVAFLAALMVYKALKDIVH